MDNKENEINTDDNNNLEQIFKLFDNNDDGFLNKEELGNILRNIGLCPSTDQINLLIEKYGNNESLISFESFTQIINSKTKYDFTKDELINAFKFFDTDNDGFISSAELRHLLLNVGEKLSEDEIDDILREVDTTGNGQINYNELVKSLLNI